MTVGVAQDDEQTPIGECGQEQFDAIADLLTVATETLQSGELDQTALVQAQIAIATLRAFCDGYVFTSEEYGTDVVTDPISFRDGVYRAVFESSTSATLTLEGLSGDCEIGAFMTTLSAGGEDQELWQLEDCVGVLDVSGREGWAFRLEPIVTTEDDE